MKKYILMLVVASLSSGTTSIGMYQSVPMTPEQEKEFMENVRYLQGRGSIFKSRAALTGAGIGGATLGTAGYSGAYHDKEKHALKAGATGAALGYLGGIGVSQARRTIIPYLINRKLHKYTGYDFQRLAPAEAAFVFAAYKRNLPMMRKALQQPGVALFATEDGMWQALADLYYNEDHSDRVYQLQKALRFSMQPGEGLSGNVSVGY